MKWNELFQYAIQLYLLDILQHAHSLHVLGKHLVTNAILEYLHSIAILTSMS